MAFKERLRRLETAVACKIKSVGRKTLEQTLADIRRLHEWRSERGYADCLAALEAGETGPEGLEDMLREQAQYDPKHRAWARIRAALKAGELPDEADLQAMETQKQDCKQ